MTEYEIALLIIQYIKEGRKNDFQNILQELRSYDIAEQYKHLPQKHHNKFLSFLTVQQLTRLIQELDIDSQLDILYKLEIKISSDVLNLMDNDDLANILDNLSTEEVSKLLGEMKEEESQAVKNLLSYPPETAGRIMTDRFVWILEDFTVRDAVNKLREFALIAESLNYLYVVDNEQRIRGVVSYKDLILANSTEKIEDIMYSRVVTVSILTDQEDVAKLIERYDFISIPVVDEDKKLVGIVTVDDIIDVILQEAREDIDKLSATGASITFDTKAYIAAGKRLPWLIMLLFIGILSGSIISRFEATLQQVVALTFFMPMIAGMTGNTGTQSLAVVVRGLIAQDLNTKEVTKLVLRESLVGVLIGVTCGLLIAFIAYFWQGNVILGVVVGSSLFLTLIIGTLAGTIIPIVLSKLNIDPAVASGPLITTINDILSLLIYFGIANVFIDRLM